MMIIGEDHDLGVFDTKEEDKIPECQYQAMINWEVKAKE